MRVLDLFLGKTAGTIGETSVVAILIGAVVLLWFEVIDLRSPGSYRYPLLSVRCFSAGMAWTLASFWQNSAVED